MVLKKCFILLMKSIKKKGEGSFFLRKLIFLCSLIVWVVVLPRGIVFATWHVVECIFLTLVTVIWLGYVYFVND